MSNNSPAFARFFLTLPPEDGLRRARLLNWITRVLSVLAIALGSILLLAPFARPAVADAVAFILLLAALAITAFCVFRAQARGHHQAATVCLNVGLALTLSLAVWQFGRRVPEVHLGYFIPIALAAMLWGSVPALVTAVSVWAANVVIVANQPGATPAFYQVEEIVGLLTLGASYVSLAIVVGRFAENLADAVSRSKQNARTAEQAEQHARASAGELAITLEAEQAHRQELGTLYNLASRLAATSKLQDLLPFTAESIVAALQVTFATIALLEQNDKAGAPRLVIASCYPCRDLRDNAEVGRAIRLSDAPTIAAALERRECCVIQRGGDLNLAAAEIDFLRAADLASLGIVPIFVGDKPLGAILLGEERAQARAALNEEKLVLARSIADLTAGAIQRSKLFEELEDAYVQTVLALAKAVEAKDTYTADHAERLAAMAEKVARALGEENPAELRALRFGAMLHDVGKIGVPDSILKKPARLTDEEWKIMRQHPVIGSQILATVARLRGAARVVRHHHERWDGKGYPDGLVGDAIPLGARILTVTDSYSAIVDARVYKAARTHAEAVAELQRNAGSQFDPQVVEAFLRISGDGTMEAEAAQRAHTLAAPLPELQTIQKMIDAVGDQSSTSINPSRIAYLISAARFCKFSFSMMCA